MRIVQLRMLHFMGVAGNEHLTVKLTGFVVECFLIAPWNYLVTMQQANLHALNFHNLSWSVLYFFLGVLQRIVFEVTLHDVHLRSQRSKPVLGLLVAEVTYHSFFGLPVLST